MLKYVIFNSRILQSLKCHMKKSTFFCDIGDTISDLPSLLAFGLSTFSRTRIASVLQSVEAANHILALHVFMMNPAGLP